MRGASRASLAEAKERLATIAEAGTASQLGEDLLAVTGLLDEEAGLRRMLSDPSRDAGAKAGLLAALLSERVAPVSLELLTSVVSARWSAPGDLPDAVEQLAVLAVVETADAEGQLDELEDELFRFGRTVNAEPGLRAALSNPFMPVERKQGLVDALLAGRVTAATLQLVVQAAAHPRGRSLDLSLEEYARLAAERRERLVAEVHVAVGLSAEQRRRLTAALKVAYGHDVHLNIVLDPQVIGGMSIRIGGELIDGSTASRLSDLRRRLAA